MSVINTNIKALIAQNAATYNNRALSTAMQQLSTGNRINSAKDDAAGLAISTRMTAQIRGLNQAVRNANDAISLVQTAEGAAIEITNMMQRMRELAVQSATDTNGTEDRAFLDLEFQELKAEINRIGANTEWNGMKILDKSFDDGSGTFAFQVGANANQTISISIGDFRSTASSVTFAAVSSATADDVQTDTLDLSALNTQYDPAEPDALLNATVLVNVDGKQARQVITKDILSQVDSETVNLAELVATQLSAQIQTVLGANFTVTATDAEIAIEGAEFAEFTTTISANAGDLSAIGETDISSKAMAQSAITAIDAAIEVVSDQRATMGATINRLTYAADNLTNVAQNTTDSRSRILDTDYAKATTELARTQIIQQAATAMLAQANSQQQTVLALLQ